MVTARPVHPRPIALLTASIAALCCGLPAAAQQTDEQAREEARAEADGLTAIVVTAQRREESVQDVPIAISAFDGAELQRRGVTEALQIAQFVPNLVGLNNTGLGSANSYYLRGLGNSETIPTFDPPIGTYVQDIYLSRQNANNLSLFDVERIEVLRGPQGTLFGRNTTGGAVSVFLQDPTDEFGGYAELGYGSYENKLARGSVNLPAFEGFAVKLSAYVNDDDGYARNSTTGERVNEGDGWGVRAAWLADLTPDVSWNFNYFHTETQAANILNFDCDPADPTQCDGRFVTTGLTKDTQFTSLLTGDKAEYGLGNDTRVDFFSSNFEFRAGVATINAITGYVFTAQDYALDFADGRGLPSLTSPRPPVRGYTFGGFTIVNEGEFEQFSQEVKVNASLFDGRFDLVTGVYYFEEDNFSDFGDIFTLPFAPPPRGFPIVLADRTLDNTTRAYAGYAQGDLNITDQITLTAGIRYTDETKELSISDNRASCNDGSIEPNCIDDANLVAANGVLIPTKQNVDVWTPRFAVNYEPDPDFLLFASATRGFKSGGWNARGTSASELLPFGPEFAWSYEVGTKWEGLGRRLRVNLTAFWLDVSDLQTPAALIRPNGSIGFITRNFADYENRGVEIELQARPVRGLNLYLSGGYQDDKYKLDPDSAPADEFGVQAVAVQQAQCLSQLAAGLVAGGDATACGEGIVASDGSLSTPVRTPEFTVAFGGSYELEFGDGTSLTPAVNVSWRDESEVGIDNVSIYDAPITSSAGTVFPANQVGNGDFIVGSFSDSRFIVNATLTLDLAERFALIAECRNCFDEEAIESSLANYSYLNPPRTWLVKARVNF